jgi:tyrosine-protein phosphatase SIW14
MRFWRYTHTLATSAVLASTMCATAPVAQTATPSASTDSADHSFGQPLTIKGVPNAGQVTPRLYRGAQPTAQGFEALAGLGINIVVDLRGSREDERERVAKLGMQYVAIPWHCPFPKDDAFAQFLTLLRQNPGKKVFVHCRLGDDRTGMMVAAFRIAEQGWTAQEAMNEMEHSVFPCLTTSSVRPCRPTKRAFPSGSTQVPNSATSMVPSHPPRSSDA